MEFTQRKGINMKKRLICLALVMVMIFTLLPMSAFAADVVASGTCGDNLAWTLDSEGTLTISGTGAMTDYTDRSNAPWDSSSSSVKSVIIENGVTSIGSCAFYLCTKLASVTIPESVTSIGNDAFDGCISLKDVYYRGDVASWIGITYNSHPCCYGANLYFNGELATDVIIPDSVTSIGDSAFSGCDSLTSVTVGNSVTSIGKYAFYGCPGLTEINYNAKAMADFTSNSKVFYSAGTAGSGINVIFGDGVEKIPAYLFKDCSGLTSLTIGNSVTSIGKYAFSGCTGLTEINYNAKAVTDLAYDADVFKNDGTAENGINVIFGEGVEKIPAYLFSGCRSLVSVTIGNSVTSIGDWAFYGCDSLTSVTIPDSVTSIGGGAFNTCTGLASVTIPDSVTNIGKYAFSGCSGLTSVTIGKSVTNIGSHAFAHCKGLTEINYNAKVMEDFTGDSNVFYNAGTSGSGIKVTFGENVKKVPNLLFSTLYNEDSPKISEIIFLGNAPAIGSRSFSSVTASAYYPYGNDTWTSEVMKDYGGHITWIPYSDAEATSFVCNGKTSYIVGEELDTSSISVTIKRSDGCIEKYNYASGEITLGEYDMSKSGKQSISVTCKGVTTKLTIYVHSLASETMPANDYPESSHNYEDNLDKTYTYTADGAYSLDVTFSSDTETEADIDYIYVNETKYTGKELANKTVHINGDTLTVHLVSDRSDGAYGFSIDSIVATYLVHEYTDTVVAPTCTEKGYTIHTCACGESYMDGYVKAIGHEYKDGKCVHCGAKDLTLVENPFVDVSESSVYYDAILWAYYHEPQQITGGYTATEFRPGNPCTRGQVVTFLWRAAGCPEPTGVTSMFKDASSIAEPYQKAVAWAVENGITTGYNDGSFRPNATCTRWAVVLFMYRDMT